MTLFEYVSDMGIESSSHCLVDETYISRIKLGKFSQTVKISEKRGNFKWGKCIIGLKGNGRPWVCRPWCLSHAWENKLNVHWVMNPWNDGWMDGWMSYIGHI